MNNNQKPEEENNRPFVLLDEIKICIFTGKKYDAIRMGKCKCECHEPNSNMIHLISCCIDGWTIEYRYIE